MKIIIGGSGIIGLSCGYVLSYYGYEVHIIDAKHSYSQETSFRNGALICPSQSKSWTQLPIVNPQVIWYTKFSLSRLLSVDFWKWSYYWVKHLVNDKSSDIEKLLTFSCEVLTQSPFSEISTSYKGIAKGTKTLDGSVYPQDHNGDIYQFSTQLYESCVEQGVKFSFNSKITNVKVEKNKIIGLEINNKETISGDIYVMSLGYRTTEFTKLLRSAYLPIQPVCGYMIDFITSKKLSYNLQIPQGFISPFKNVMKASGFADFSEPQSFRFDQLFDRILNVFPDAKIINKAYGYRPLTPDDAPYIGRLSPYENLYFCTGHGSKGWTAAFGSAVLMYQLIRGIKTSIPTAPYDPNRM